MTLTSVSCPGQKNFSSTGSNSRTERRRWRMNKNDEVKDGTKSHKRCCVGFISKVLGLDLYSERTKFGWVLEVTRILVLPLVIMLNVILVYTRDT